MHTKEPEPVKNGRVHRGPTDDTRLVVALYQLSGGPTKRKPTTYLIAHALSRTSSPKCLKSLHLKGPGSITYFALT